MSFADTAVLFLLALLLFGPKKLPGIARQVGKALNEFKRASNEFKAQIEAEISQLEIEERRKKNEEEQKKVEGEQKILPPAAPPEHSIHAMRTADQIESSPEPVAAPEPVAPPEPVESSGPNPTNV
jgi:sec-independent protein translocase protein TatB